MDTPNDASDDVTTDRHPCPDDLCVGVLDADGVCGTCGRHADPPPALSRADEVWEDDGGAEPNEEELRAEAEAAGGDGEEPADDERRPCSDDLCTGVLAANGVCGTCGRTAQ